MHTIFREVDKHPTLSMVAGRINGTHISGTVAVFILAKWDWKREQNPVELTVLVFYKNVFDAPQQLLERNYNGGSS